MPIERSERESLILTRLAREGSLAALAWPAVACLVCAGLVLLAAADPPRATRDPDAAPPASTSTAEWQRRSGDGMVGRDPGTRPEPHPFDMRRRR